MKKLLLLILLFSMSAANAKNCVFSWDASISTDIEYYNLYNGMDIFIPNIAGLTHVAECQLGDFTVTAVNRFGIESDKSNNVLIKKPEAPSNLDAKVQDTPRI